jgi:hypothetical protein
MRDLLDQQDAFAETVPGLPGRLDPDSVAIAELLRVCACGTP